MLLKSLAEHWYLYSDYVFRLVFQLPLFWNERINIDIFGKSSSKKFDILATVYSTVAYAILPIINIYMFFIAGFCFF